MRKVDTLADDLDTKGAALIINGLFREQDAINKKSNQTVELKKDAEEYVCNHKETF